MNITLKDYLCMPIDYSIHSDDYSSFSMGKSKPHRFLKWVHFYAHYFFFSSLNAPRHLSGRMNIRFALSTNMNSVASDYIRRRIDKRLNYICHKSTFAWVMWISTIWLWLWIHLSLTLLHSLSLSFRQTHRKAFAIHKIWIRYANIGL